MSNVNTAEDILQAIQARLQGDWDNPKLAQFGPHMADTMADIRDLIVQPRVSEAEVAGAREGEAQVFIVNTSDRNDEETMRAFDDRHSMVVYVANTFVYDGDAELDSGEFWDEISENYDLGEWKAFHIGVMDPKTLKIETFQQPTASRFAAGM
ncbi:hypothetical protein AYJ57_21490 (plasmid) [Salipiger sp. CCB-MM3]|uniref:hypothetical protein n=1 Tax=Salipiger sp. CCB-MM3 TaxID=1792508 RepID=UPI00080A9A67|nr:hypothetical protein [Salipiger sp. CCB-MM3]ANT63050.1 hypothetical protein AYJ57_21490 [Salipiger sp. CCB-MM3]